MTEPIKSAIDFFKKYRGCDNKFCSEECKGIKCEDCEFDYEVSDTAKNLDIAIRSLQAWEEVLNELNDIRNNPRANLNQYFIDGISVATEIINQHSNLPSSCQLVPKWN